MRLLRTILLPLLYLFVSIAAQAQTQGNLSVTFTTSKTARGQFAPRNVMTVWISNSSGTVIKTLVFYAASYKSSLIDWTKLSLTPDVTTGASLTSFGTYTYTWDGKDKSGVLVADGTYIVNIEMNDSNSPSPSSHQTTTFTKGPTSQTLNPTNITGITATTVKWTPVIVPSIAISTAKTSICSGEQVTFTAAITNGGTAPSYQWKVNGSNAGTNAATFTTNTLANASSVSCTLTSNAVGATPTSVTSSAISMTVSPSLVPSVSIATTSAVLCSGASISYTATVTNGGTAPIYTWKINGTAVGSVSSYTATNFANNDILSCDVQSNALCASPATVSASKTLNVVSSPQVSIAPSATAVCSGKSATLTASGASSYQWSTQETNAGISVSPTSNTTYTVSGTSNGCTSIASQQITANSTPTISFSPANPSVCLGDQLSITASGGNSYNWNTTANTASINETPTANTSYTVTATSLAGCESVATVAVSVKAKPTVTVNPQSASICAGSKTMLTASGAVTYAWNNGLGSGASVSVSPATDTRYTVTGTNSVGCSDTVSAVVSIRSSLTVNLSPTAKTICKGESLSMTASGALNYTWNTLATGSSLLVTPQATTTYTVTGTDINGCTGTASATITVNDLPTISISASKSSICEGESVNISASGAASYAWSTGASANSFLAKPAFSQVYAVTASGANNCSDTASVHVTVNPLPQLTVASSAESVCKNTALQLTASGADAFAWSTGAVTSAIKVTPQTSTSFSVTGTSANCSTTVSKSVTVRAVHDTVIQKSVCGSFSYDNQTYTQSGTSQHHFTSASGCDSVVTLQLTVRQPSRSTASYTGCDAQYVFNGKTFTQSGDYEVVIPNAVGCDSIIALHLVLNKPTAGSITQISAGSFTCNNQTYTQSGTFTQHLTNKAGCDSTLTIYLTIQNKDIDTSIVSCGTLVFNGVEYTQSNTYTIPINGGGTITLHATIKQPTQSTISRTACGSYTFDGKSYTQSGTYYSHKTNAAGCDSLITLQLTINSALTNSIAIRSCGAYIWNNQSYDHSGTFQQILRSASGCDSVVTLNLTVNQASTSSLTVVECDRYVFNNETFTKSDVVTRTIKNKAGCDSVVTLNITINHSVIDTIRAEANGLYVLNSTQYTIAATYKIPLKTSHGCDSTIVLILKMADVTALQSAIAAAQALASISTAGSDLGQYPDTAITYLQTALAQARTALGNKAATQAIIDVATATLNTSVLKFKSSVNGGVNKTALIDALAAARDTLKKAVAGSNPGNYPQSAINDLSAAIKAAQDVADSLSATSAQVATAVKDLSDALTIFAGQKVLTANKTALMAALTSADSLLAIAKVGDKPGQYPAASIDSLKTVFAVGQRLATATLATQDSVDVITNQLNTLISIALRSKVGQPDKTALGNSIQTALDKLKNYEPGNLPSQIPASALSNFQSTVQLAQQVYNDTTRSQATVDAVNSALSAAIIAVSNTQIPIADRTALNAVIEQATSIKQLAVVGDLPNQYPAATVQQFANAIQSAQTMSSTQTAWQRQIDSTTNSLQAAIETFKAGIIPSTDKTALSKAISTAQARIAAIKTPANYPDSMITMLNTVLQASQTIFANKMVSQTNIDAQTKALTDAIAAFDKSRILDPNEIQFVTDLPSTIYTSAGTLVSLPIVVTPNNVSYEWQVDAGNGFVDLSTSLQYIGIHRNTLGIKAIPANFESYKYRCIVTNGQFTDTSTVATINFGQPTATSEQTADYLYIYPNPATDIISVETSIAVCDTKFEVITQQGATVLNGVLNTTNTNVNISTLPAGVYFLRLKNKPSDLVQFIKK